MKLVFRCATVAALLVSAATLVHAAPTLISFQEGVSPTAGYTHGATYVYSGTPAAIGNTSSSGSLVIGNDSFFGAAPGGARGLFEFDLSAIETAVGGNPYQIDSVQLVLFARGTSNSSTGAGNSISIDLRAFAEDFDETTASWNSLTPNGGLTTGTVLTSQTFDPTPTGNGVDVTFPSSAAFTAAAQSALDGDNILRFMGIRTDTAGGDVFARFYYDETGTFASDLKPELIIGYTLLSPAVVPEPSTFALMGVVIVGAGIWGVRRRWTRDG